jgi:hypothetical protein
MAVNVVGQLLQDLQAQKAGVAHDEAQAWRDLKRQVDAREMLADLVVTHGLLIEKYEVVKGRDGVDRIRCGTRHLSLSDFLTRELHLPWPDAEGILREAHSRQHPQGPQAAQRPLAPMPELWQDFMHRRRTIVAVDRAAGRHQAKLDAMKGRAAIMRAYRVAKTEAGLLPPNQRRARISIARMARVVAEARLREDLRAQRVAVRIKARRDDAELYRDYLQERAQIGDEVALKELRRMSQGLQLPAAARQGVGVLRGPVDDDAMQVRSAVYSGAGLTYSVEANGDVTYKIGGTQVLRDSARKIDVLVEDAATLETALRIAQQKFVGATLNLNGGRGFQEKVARSAAEHRLAVRFTDERLNNVMHKHRLEIDAAARASKVPGKDLGR